MKPIHPYYNQFVDIAKSNPKFFVTTQTLIVTENNKLTQINLNRITKVRIIKQRELFANYFLIIMIAIIFHFSNEILTNNFSSQLIVYSIALTAILASLRIKIYTHSVLINMMDLSFIKLKIVAIKVKNNPYFVHNIRNIINHLFCKGYAK